MNKRIDVMTAMKREMDTMCAVLESLRIKDQDNEFAVLTRDLLTLKGKIYHQRDISILRTYRFEGESDPADQAIIYVIKTLDGNMGYSLDAYGMYSSHTSDLFSDFIHDAGVLTSTHKGSGIHESVIVQPG